MFPSCERIFDFGNGQLSQHRPQARAARKLFEDAEKCSYHANVFFNFEMDNFPQHRPHHLFLNSFLSPKIPTVCVDKIQSPATRKVCVHKSERPATTKVNVDRIRTRVIKIGL